MKCVKCSMEIEEGAVFCGYCGVKQAKFAKYIEKVRKKIHKDRDKEYNNNVKNAQNKLNKLEQARINEINRIKTNRWRSIVNGFSYNMTEGKININGQNYIFSDIKGAEVTIKEGFRTVTNTTGTNNVKSKKHASLGGAVVGGLAFGALGAVVGGSALGKTTSKGNTRQTTTSNDIPVCYHLGVLVNINGFNTEIVILSNTVDQNSPTYNNAVQKAQNIIDTLRNLSLTPVPESWLQPEEEQSVLDFNAQIENAKVELQSTIDNKPNYDIPRSYYE